MAKTLRYGIKFPFTTESYEKKFVDLDLNPSDGIKSRLMHLIFTPVGQRLRRPQFGSKLIQFLFNPDDRQTWDDIVSEIRTMVSSNIQNCNINNIEVYDINDGMGVAVKIRFTVTDSQGTYEDEIITDI